MNKHNFGPFAIIFAKDSDDLFVCLEMLFYFRKNNFRIYPHHQKVQEHTVQVRKEEKGNASA